MGGEEGGGVLEWLPFPPGDKYTVQVSSLVDLP